MDLGHEVHGGNDEALFPGLFTHQAAQKRLADPVVTAAEFDPGAAVLAKFQIASNLLQLAVSADGDALDATRGHEAAFEGSHDAFADELIPIHRHTPT